MSLVNKYRPVIFNDFVGNKIIVNTLASGLNSLPSSKDFLITGGTGVGKTTLSRLTSRSILKKSPTDYLESDFNYREYDCGVNGKIELSRRVLSELNLKFSGSKVIFFDECSSLTQDAQIALLKALERGIKNLYFIFATTDPAKLHEALKNRCIRYHLEPPTEGELFKLLRKIAYLERKTVHVDALHQIAKYTPNRSPRAAIITLGEILNLPGEEQMEALLSLMTCN